MGIAAEVRKGPRNRIMWASRAPFCTLSKLVSFEERTAMLLMSEEHHAGYHVITLPGSKGRRQETGDSFDSLEKRQWWLAHGTGKKGELRS